MLDIQVQSVYANRQSGLSSLSQPRWYRWGSGPQPSAAWAEGQVMTLEQAIAYALEDAPEAAEQTATSA